MGSQGGAETPENPKKPPLKPNPPPSPQLCKRYPGFMRVALSEPQPERR